MLDIPLGFEQEHTRSPHQDLLDMYSGGAPLEIGSTNGDAVVMPRIKGGLSVMVPHGDDLDRTLHAVAQVVYQFPVDGLEQSLRHLSRHSDMGSVVGIYNALQSARTLMYGQLHFPHRSLASKALRDGMAWRQQQFIRYSDSPPTAAAAIWMTAVGSDPTLATSNPHYLDVVDRYADDIRRAIVTPDFGMFYSTLTTLLAELAIPPSPQPPSPPPPPPGGEPGEGRDTPGGSNPQQSEDSEPDDDSDSSDASDADGDSDAPPNDGDADTEPSNSQTSGQAEAQSDPGSESKQTTDAKKQRERDVAAKRADIQKQLGKSERESIKNALVGSSGRQTNNIYHGKLRDHEITVVQVASEITKMTNQSQLLARDNSGGNHTGSFTTSGAPTNKMWQLNIGNTKVWRGKPPHSGKVAVLVDMSASMGCWCDAHSNQGLSAYGDSGFIAMQIAAVIAASNDDIVVAGFAGDQDIIAFEPGYQPLCRYELDIKSSTPTCVGLEWMSYQVGADGDGATIVLITDGSPSACSGGHGPEDHTRQLAQELYQSGAKFACILVNRPSMDIIDMYPSPITAVVNTMDDLRNVQVILDSLK